MQFEDGCYYKGDFKEGKFDGQGELTKVDKSK